MSQNNTINKFLDNFNSKQIDNFDARQAITIIKDIADKIPANGEYDPSIIGLRIGQYIYAIQECGKLLANLGLVEKYQETETEKEFACAALERAAQRGYVTDGKSKLYAQMDEAYIGAKNKLNDIQAVIMYIESYRSSLDKAHLHCKKILDRGTAEERFAHDHEKFTLGSNRDSSWINDDDLK